MDAGSEMVDFPIPCFVIREMGCTLLHISNSFTEALSSISITRTQKE
jgi:hypothetical protein